MFGRVTAFVYGILCYAAFLASFLYAIGFLGNFGVPKPMDSGAQLPLLPALAIDAGLLLIGYGYSHTVSTRLSLKKQLLVHGLFLLVPLAFLIPNGPFNITGSSTLAMWPGSGISEGLSTVTMSPLFSST